MKQKKEFESKITADTASLLSEMVVVLGQNSKKILHYLSAVQDAEVLAMLRIQQKAYEFLLIESIVLLKNAGLEVPVAKDFAEDTDPFSAVGLITAIKQNTDELTQAKTKYPYAISSAHKLLDDLMVLNQNNIDKLKSI